MKKDLSSVSIKYNQASIDRVLVRLEETTTCRWNGGQKPTEWRPSKQSLSIWLNIDGYGRFRASLIREYRPYEMLKKIQIEVKR